MAKYTTTLADIIMDMADPRIPRYDFKGLIEDVWEKIVPTKFPMWTEFQKPINGWGFEIQPRKRLICKILAHYYTWEIGYETQNMWMFAFNRKLGEIMPYYVELEKTMDMDFNPFHTVDMREEYQGQNNVTENRNGTEELNSILSNTTENNFLENSNGTVRKGEDGWDHSKDDKSGKEITDGWQHVDTDSTNTLSHGKKEKITSKKITDDLSVNKYNSTNTHTKTGKEKTDNDNWNKYSATPQSKLSGIIDEKYLTDARKIEDDTTITYNTKDIDKKTGHDDLKYDGNESINSTNSFSGRDVTTVSNEENNSNKDTVTYDNHLEKNSSYDHNSSENSESDKHGTSNSSESSNSESSKNTSNQKNEIGENNYIKTTKGRNSNNIIDQVILYRENIINIELMIIKEMQDLFMQVF